ncbi:hydantoinase B/oxoprolinase family protein [Rhodococcus sp. 14-2483-1-2]|uniref:hydantoinase B/oxoprolinase family protein n=1 Tax=Rhodococcus sp. 14-2483-1-2 TaxID=2023147 RepID=UPI000B9BD935|nr:hydantoinase B/oxoprolinase family protein [Rhodococcus sp. 14-2483-1-2]OZF26065.1 hypothetical protein CH295_25890 [Rhodococcus sp. 14-2483-1-2]
MTSFHYATDDGVVRNPQIDFVAYDGVRLDGIHASYIPRPELAISASLNLHDEADLSVDPITYQVLRSRLWHMNVEHGDIIQRVTGSAPVVYSKDFATALLTEDGEIVVVSPTVQVFSTLADLVVKWTLEYRSEDPGIQEGDIFLQNSPFVAAGQQPDTAVFAPVFVDGRLFAWAYNALHMGDLGGVDAGGWAVHARDRFEDGAATPPVKIADRGVVRSDVISMWVHQGRDSETLRLNINSGIAGVRAMTTRIRELVEEQSAATVKGAMRKMIAAASRVVGDRLDLIPDGTWTQRSFATGATGVDRVSHREVLTIQKQGRHITCRNDGTSPQSGPGNSTYSVLRSGIVSALAAALAWDQRGCLAGVADHVMFEPTFGTRNAANPPAATSAIYSAVTTMNIAGLVVSQMLLAAPPELRRRASAAGGFSMPMADVSFGMDQQMHLIAPPGSVHGALMAGAIGAFPDRDGINSGGSWHMLGTSAGNVEDYESEGVGLALYRREKIDSGGPGRWRGGNGVEAAWMPHDAFLSFAQLVFVEPGANMATGLAGGYFGSSGNQLKTRDGAVTASISAGRMPGSREQLIEAGADPVRVHPQSAFMPLAPGTALIAEYSAGGGYGDPLDREGERILDDIRDGHISREAAERVWGIVFTSSGDYDEPGTATARSRIRNNRLTHPDYQAPMPRPAPTGKIEKVLLGAAGPVDLIRVDTALGWSCGRCAVWLGPATDSHVAGAGVKQVAPQDIDPPRYLDPKAFGDPSIVVRQYLCPNCGALLLQDFCTMDEPIPTPIQLDALVAVGDRR